jgi:hypothetical protein
MNQFLNMISQGLFSYQIAVVARPRPMLHHLLEHARTASQARLEQTETVSMNGKE